MQEYTCFNKLFEASVKENWDREALSNYRGATLTYGELAGRIAQLQAAFATHGVGRGDKIALCSRNQANWAVCFLAAITYGAVPVPLLHEFKPENVHFLVNHSDARLLFVDDQIWENLNEAEMPELTAMVQMSTMFETFAPDAPGEDFGPESVEYYDAPLDDLALINYTSGTSGFSKGVMLSHRAVACNIRFAKETAEPQMNCESEIVAMLPSAHMYGLMFELLFEMTIGAHVHFLTRVPSPKIIMQAFADIHPDIIIAVPLIIEKVYKSQIKPIADRTKAYRYVPILSQTIRKKIREGLIAAFGGRFEEIILGGAAFNPEVEAFLREIHFPFTVGYGMTECCPIITYEKWYRTRKGSCGKAIPGCEIRIDSINPHKVPGEVQVKGDNVFMGYYKNRQATKASFTNDDWFKTGDMGIIDDDGYLYLRGRSKCMILGPSGQNIYPEELEAVINNFNYIVESLVIEDGGSLTAIVYPDYHQAELDGLSGEELEERLTATLPDINKLLPGYAAIRKMEFIPEDFERTPKRSIKRYLYQR